MTVGRRLNSPGAKIATLDFLKVDRKLRLPFSGGADLDSSLGGVMGVSSSSSSSGGSLTGALGYKEVIVSVEALDTGRVLRIVPYKDSNQDINIVKK